MTVVRDKRERGDAPTGGTARRRLRWLLPALGIIAFLLVGGPLGAVGGKLSQVQKNDSAAYLPASAESTEVDGLARAFTGAQSLPAFVVYTRTDGLTDADRREISDQVAQMRDHFGDKLQRPPVGPLLSEDGQAAQVILPFAGTDAQKLKGEVDWVREFTAGSSGLRVYVTGPAGILGDLLGAFEGIDSVLLLVTGLVVLVILIFVYRSPILPFVVLLVAGTALGIANGVVYLLARADVVTVSGQTQGILDVLVLGAGTDYALLLVSRFREELRRHEDRYAAMRTAWRAAVEPILASGGTVILGLLCLLVSDLGTNRGLGPVAAIGIACALVAMLGLLPVVMVLLGRAAFWPFRPGYGSRPAEERGLWARVAGLVGRRARVVWLVTAVILGGLAFMVTRLESSGIPQTEQFVRTVDSKTGQDVLAQHFPAGSGSPAVVIARADRLDEVVAAAARVPGVAQVTPYADIPVAQPGGGQRPGGAAQPPAPAPPKVVDGLVRVEATLAVRPDSPQGFDVVRNLRAAVHAIPGADARVGGFTAVNLDVQDTSRRDRMVIIPIVLAVVLLVLMVLLRALVAPVMLILTVMLSFLAALGVSAVVFREIMHHPQTDASFPLFAFVFLVALGVDYNIFLMTRVREEVGKRGHREGTLAGLAVTGGVITSAGVVLAATFAALLVLPLVFLAQIAFTVAFGVLLDTLVVRSLLVPALTVDIGRSVWWPGKLRRIGR
jgi:putative drug exporter of the RND superfamily